MVKRKVVSKNVPPDVSAAKLLIGLNSVENDLKNLTDEELYEEKQRLLKILTESENEINCN